MPVMLPVVQYRQAAVRGYASMIKVRIRVHGHARTLMPGERDEFQLELQGPATVADMLRDHIGVNPMVFATVVVNGQRQPRDFLVEGDADILLMSPVAGGSRS